MSKKRRKRKRNINININHVTIKNLSQETKNSEIDFKYTYNHVKRFYFLESSKGINKLKSFSVPIFILILFITTIFFGFSNYSFEKFQVGFKYEELNNKSYILIAVFSLISLLIINLSSLITHSIAYNQILKARKNSSSEAQHKNFFIKGEKTFLKEYNAFFKKHYIKSTLKLLSSPDLFFAQFYKNKIINSVDIKGSSKTEFTDCEYNKNTLEWSMIRIEKKAFIEISNWLNIIYTVIFITINCILLCIYNDCIFLHQFLLTLTIHRIISRGFEISIAFYYDVVQVNSKQFKAESDETNYQYINGFQSSLIRQNGRLSLAIHSLIEMILIFALGYYLLFEILTNISEIYFLTKDTLIYNKDSLIFEYIQESTRPSNPPTLFECIILSTTLGIFNISYNAYTNIILALFHASQVIISAILILLSIAQYLGNDHTLNSNDIKLYNRVSKIKNIINGLGSDSDFNCAYKKLLEEDRKKTNTEKLRDTDIITD
ncbi:hypothetical protein [Priestia aryabhattai]